MPHKHDAHSAGADNASTERDAAQRAASFSHGAYLGRGPSFRTRLTLLFAGLVLVTALVFVGILTIVWNFQFSAYTRTTLDELANAAASTLSASYDERGYWSAARLQSAAQSASGIEDVGIQILNANDVIVYDSTLPDTGKSSSGFDSDISLAPSTSSDMQNVVEKEVVSSAGAHVGTVRVWVYGSDVLLTQRDMSFRSSSLFAIAMAAVVSLVIAVAMGIFLTGLLTKPLRQISLTAKAIQDGDLTARTELRGNDDLGQLGVTFDEMAESIQRDRELERRLTADVAHELRTPLMSILATVEAMEDEVLPCDQEHLALVAGETKRLSRLVDGMLRLSRLESGSVHLKIVSLDMVKFVNDIVTSHSAMLGEAGLEMTFANTTGEDRLMVEFDRDTVTQAVTNIVSNAMRYTPAPGKVEVGVGREGDEALVWVRDTGIGIAPENINRVFGRFWRAEESRNRVAGGLGVGLAVTKEIIDRHHGHIDVTSQQGVGTTFTLRIPLVQPVILPEKKDDAKPSAATSGNAGDGQDGSSSE